MSLSPLSPSSPTTTPSCNKETLRCAAYQVKPKAVQGYRSLWGRRENLTSYYFSVLSRERRQWGDVALLHPSLAGAKTLWRAGDNFICFRFRRNVTVGYGHA